MVGMGKGPRPKCERKVIRDSNPDFCINPDLDVYRITPKMLWIHCHVGVSQCAKFHKKMGH